MLATENTVIQRFKQARQSHVFESYNSLSDTEKKSLLTQAAEIDLFLLHAVTSKLLPISKPTPHVHMEHISPPKPIKLPQNECDTATWSRARSLGEKQLQSSKVAVLTVAGGHGTRLGISCPKGTLVVTPIRQKSLFQVFAEKILGAQNKYRCVINWFVMTSSANHKDTLEFFNKHHYFNLSPDNVHFFKQGQMSALDFSGKIIMESPSSISMSPDGHGGSFYALKAHGLLHFMAKHGIETLSYHQVDNPLARIIDPAFIGFHIEAQSDFSSKMVSKTKPDEKVGLFCSINKQLQVIEYSDFPKNLLKQQDQKGHLKFNAANVAIHLFNRSFLERITEQQGLLESLPFHRAVKKIPFWKAGPISSPTEPNGIRFERFIFDALSFAHNPILIQTQRSSEFSPIKNSTGSDSLETCLQDQHTLFLSWLSTVLPKENLGTIKKIEISPLFADSEEDFIESWNKRPQKLSLDTNECYIE